MNSTDMEDDMTTTITAKHWDFAVTGCETISALGDGLAADRACRVMLDLEEAIEQQPIVTAEDAMLRLQISCAMLERQMDADDPALLGIQAALSFLRRA